MEQKDFLKNISGTVCVVGLALSTMSLNSTMVVDGNYKMPSANYSFFIIMVRVLPILTVLLITFMSKQEAVQGLKQRQQRCLEQ